MKTTIRATIFFCSWWIVGCATSSGDHPYGLLTEPRIEDAVPLPSGREPTLQEIAFTFPVFEIGHEATLANIKRGDAQVEVTHDTWTLFGDGAQTTVRVERLSRRDLDPLRISLSLGPVFDGGISNELPIYRYHFTREASGWVRTHYEREMKKVEQGAPSNGG